jgi:two-component system cell cycle response regulator
VIITALDQAADKVQGLAAGADDFLAKPVDDIALITRVRNLVRLKALTDEPMLRCATGAQLGAKIASPEEWQNAERPGRILLVEDQPAGAKRVTQSLSDVYTIDVEARREGALARLAEESYELLIVSLGLRAADALRLCGQVHAAQGLRDLPIVLLVRPAKKGA